jgi:MFS family permease
VSSAEGTSLRANLRALPREAWILYAGTFVNRFGSFVATFLVLYLRSKGYAPIEAGGAAGAYGAGSLAAATVGGYLADRLGRRNTIVLSMFSVAAAMLGLSQAGSLPAIVALTAAIGFTGELYRPAAQALLGDLVPAERRVAAFAAYRLAVNAGFAFGPAVAGFLADRSFFLLFLGDAATSIVFGVIALVALPHGTRSRRSEERRGEAFRTILADRAFLLFCLATLVAALVYMQIFAALPLHVRDSGLSNVAFGWLISLNGLVIVLVELPLVAFTQRLPARPVMALGNLLVAVGFGLTAFSHDVLPLVGTVLVWTFGEMVGAPVANAYVQSFAPPHLRGRYSGTWGLTNAIGLILAPVGGTALYQWSPGALWAACAVLGTVAAALILLGPRRRVVPTIAGPEAVELPGMET